MARKRGSRLREIPVEDYEHKAATRPTNPPVGLALLDRVVGAAAIVAPGPLLTGFGAPADADTPALRYTTRLFGIRNVALGVQGWQARKDPTRLTTLSGQNATVELTDFVAGAVVTSTDPEMRRPGWR